MTHPSRGMRSMGSQLPATIALGLVALTTLNTFHGLVADVRFYLYVGFVIIATHTLAWVFRVLHMPTWLAAPLAAIVPIAVAFAALYGHLPSLNLLASDAGHAIDDLGSTRVVETSSRGLIGLFVLMFGLVATTADWLAFRRHVLIESIAGYFALFAFGATLGANDASLVTTSLFLASVLAYCALHIVDTRVGAVGRGTRTGATRVYLQSAAIVSVAALTLGAIIAPMMPGYGETGIVQNYGANLGHDEEVSGDVSPLVSIRSTLVQQSSTEQFTARTNVSTYWRQYVLNDYDNGEWKQEGGISSFVPFNATDADRHTEITIGGLDTLAAPSQLGIANMTLDGTIDPNESTIAARYRTERGVSYAMSAAVPTLSPDDLRRHGNTISPEIMSSALQPTTTPAVTALAHQITQSGTTGYDQALAIQNYLRNNYTYDLSPPTPPDNADPADFFLFQSKRGFCQQFAGTFGVLARSIGLPTRVVVGYTPGTADASGLLHVYGYQAHAWPEVYFTDIGWVGFEPTPGRGLPDGTDYTGIAAEQAADPQTTPTTAAQSSSTTVVQSQSTPTTAVTNQKPTIVTQKSPHRGFWIACMIFVAIIGMVLILLRRRRRTPTDLPTAWRHVERALTRKRLRRQQHETKATYARRCRAILPPDLGAQLSQVATEVDRTTFSETEGNTEHLAQSCVSLAGSISHWKKRKENQLS